MEQIETKAAFLSINLHVSGEPLGERIENEWMVSFDISQWDPRGDKGCRHQR